MQVNFLNNLSIFEVPLYVIPKYNQKSPKFCPLEGPLTSSLPVPETNMFYFAVTGGFIDLIHKKQRFSCFVKNFAANIIM